MAVAMGRFISALPLSWLHHCRHNCISPLDWPLWGAEIGSRWCTPPNRVLCRTGKLPVPALPAWRRSESAHGGNRVCSWCPRFTGHVSLVPSLSPPRESTDASARTHLVQDVCRRARAGWQWHPLADTECVCLEASANVISAPWLVLPGRRLLLPLWPGAPKLAEGVWSVVGIPGI